MARAPLVLVTSIPRSVLTGLGVHMDNASVNQRLGALVTAGGGLPVAADAWEAPESYVERVDAVVINGGTDVAPWRYGAEPHESTDRANDSRDEFELGLVAAARERGLPVLGICRGMHVLNVALGGGLIQHLPAVTSQSHWVADRHDQPVHEVELEPDSVVGKTFGRRRTSVNSVHHQAIDQLGTGLRVTARSADGIPEAVEDESGRLVGVQWHPEFLAGTSAGKQIPLFAAMVAACRATVV